MLGFIAQNARSAWAESSLGAPKMLLVLILGWAEAEVSRAAHVLGIGNTGHCPDAAWSGQEGLSFTLIL